MNPKALRTHVLRLLGTKTIMEKPRVGARLNRQRPPQSATTTTTTSGCDNDSENKFDDGKSKFNSKFNDRGSNVRTTIGVV